MSRWEKQSVAMGLLLAAVFLLSLWFAMTGPEDPPPPCPPGQPAPWCQP